MYCSLEAIATTLSNGKKKPQGFSLLFSCFVCPISLGYFTGSCCQVSPLLSRNLAAGGMNVVFKSICDGLY